MAIYWRLREVLDAKGVTPLDLARALKKEHPNIYRLARQKHVSRITVHGGMLDEICAALDCEPGELLTRSTPDKPARPKRKGSR